jgi:hypothetical protein
MELVNTDLGLVERENANWLFTRGVISRKGNILGTLVTGLSQKRILLYSYLLWALEDIRRNTPETPIEVNLSIDDYLTIAREGEVKKEYKKDGQNYIFTIRGKKVEDVERAGKEAFVKNQPQSKSKQVDLSTFDDL